MKYNDKIDLYDNIKANINYETDITKYDFSIRRKVASRFETREDVLDILSFDPNYKIRVRVASNISTPKETLLRMTKDENPMVRASIISNKYLDKKLFNELVNDEHTFVKLRIIECPFINEDILKKYMKDKEKRVKIHSELKLNGIEIKHNVNLHALETMTPSYKEKNKKNIKEPKIKEIIFEEIQIQKPKEKEIEKEVIQEILDFPKIEILSEKELLNFFKTKRNNTIEKYILILKNYETLSTNVLITMFNNALDLYGSYKFNNINHNRKDIINGLLEYNNPDFLNKLINSVESINSIFEYYNKFMTIENLNKIYDKLITIYKLKKNKDEDSFSELRTLLSTNNIDEELNLKIFNFYQSKIEILDDYKKFDFISKFYKNNEKFQNKEIEHHIYNELKKIENNGYQSERLNNLMYKILSNQNIKNEVIDLFKISNNHYNLITLMNNQSIPKEILKEILNSNNLKFKEYLSLSKETPINTLEKLVKDSNIEIQMNAYKTLEILFEEFEKGELDLDI